MMQNPIKKLIVAALIDHEARPAIAAAATAPEHAAQLLAELATGGVKISKQDLLSMELGGKPLFDSAKAWQNFDKIQELLLANGESLTLADVTQPLQIEGVYNSRTLIQMAIAQPADSKAVGKLFRAELWGTALQDMSSAYFHVPIEHRPGFDFRSARWQIAQQLGIQLRDEVLAKAGFDDAAKIKLMQAIIEGDMPKAQALMKERGLFLTAEDLVYPDRDGETILHRPDIWQHYDKICDALAENSQKLGMAEFTRRWGKASTVLEKAAETKNLGKIFNPRHWVGRLAEMGKLWQAVPDHHRGQVKFQDLMAAAEELTFAASLNLDAGLDKNRLLQPMVMAGAEHSTNIIPMSLKSVWRRMDEIKAALEANGDSLTLEDLRGINPRNQNSFLYIGCQYGMFEEITQLIASSGEKLQLADLLTPQGDGKRVLDLLVEQKQLDQLFAPALWAGRAAEMQQLWDAIPADKLSKEFGAREFQHALGEVNVASVQEQRRRWGGPKIAI